MSKIADLQKNLAFVPPGGAPPGVVGKLPLGAGGKIPMMGMMPGQAPPPRTKTSDGGKLEHLTKERAHPQNRRLPSSTKPRRVKRTSVRRSLPVTTEIPNISDTSVAEDEIEEFEYVNEDDWSYYYNLDYILRIIVEVNDDGYVQLLFDEVPEMDDDNVVDVNFHYEDDHVKIEILPTEPHHVSSPPRSPKLGSSSPKAKSAKGAVSATESKPATETKAGGEQATPAVSSPSTVPPSSSSAAASTTPTPSKDSAIAPSSESSSISASSSAPASAPVQSSEAKTPKKKKGGCSMM